MTFWIFHTKGKDDFGDGFHSWWEAEVKEENLENYAKAMADLDDATEIKIYKKPELYLEFIKEKS